MLALDRYASAIRLDEPFAPLLAPPGVDEARARDEALEWLLRERGRTLASAPWGTDADGLLRRLLTIRHPGGIPSHVHACLDQVLAARAHACGAVGPDELRAEPGPALPIGGSVIRIWRGDITRLALDAIVNAANAELLGCFRPGHGCIDNAIHNAAGPRLRDDCATIIDIQGHREDTGDAKITRAYHLPSRFVLHTVGPIVVDGRVRSQDEHALSSSYRSCMDLAHSMRSVRTLAFCGVSTGVFGYPKAQAAEVAVGTVSNWLRDHPGALDLVVFNVFSEADLSAYQTVMDAAGQEREV
jgi:O-acetyl-ADP-ribose deacetylase (regulator of RNase III)